jgi:glycosyltransferase involved in cell wall biosynthesis
MRVLWVAPPGAEHGGAGYALAEYVTVLDGCGHRVHVVVSNDSWIVRRVERCAQVHVCPQNRWIGEDPGHVRTARWMAYNLARATPELAATIARERIDVVVSDTMTTVSGALAARWRGVPHLWNLSEFATAAHGQHYLLGRRPTHMAMRHLTSVSMAVSGAVADHFRPHLRGVDLRVVYQPVRVGNAGERPVRRGSAGLSLVMVGAISEGKRQLEGVAGLHRALQLGADVSLRIVGSASRPDELEHLNRTVRTLNLGRRVTVEPFRADIAAVFSSADALLTCSRDEGFGRVSVEAMKSGLPVIGARSGATPEVLDGGAAGWLYTPGDVDELASILHRLTVERAGVATMGARAAGWAHRKFTVSACGQALEGALTAAVAAGPAGRGGRAPA